MKVVSKHLFLQDYLTCYREMQKQAHRSADSPDQIWSLEHNAVVTVGKSAGFSNILSSNMLPVIETDRGGQVTYHGPGQLVIYTIINYRRSSLSPRKFVEILEEGVLQFLFDKGIDGQRRRGAPGVYINEKKIASIGLRFGKNFSYHGLSLNLDMDLSHFDNIYTCGYKELEVTQLASLGIRESLFDCAEELRSILIKLIYNGRAVVKI